MARGEWDLAGSLAGQAHTTLRRAGTEGTYATPLVGAELVLSPHTIKAEVKSIYRKLAACSRNQAITRAREHGLLEG
jgi:DNA-binding CsgD family transcriptional regulator